MALLKPLTASDRKWLRYSRRIILVGLSIYLVCVSAQFLQTVLADGTPVLMTNSDNEWTNPATQKKLCRTSDGTIHAGLWYDSSPYPARHFWSTNNGSSWSYENILTDVSPFSIDCTSADDLIVAAVNRTDATKLLFRRGIVNKTGGSWTWNWAATVIAASSYAYQFPDIVADSNNHYHIIADTTTASTYWLRSLNNGSTWTATAQAYLPYNWAYTSIITDSADNLYFSWNYYDCTKDLVLKRVAYLGNDTWDIPTTTIMGGGNICITVLNMTPNDYLSFTYSKSAGCPSPGTLCIYFARSSYAQSISGGFATAFVVNVMTSNYPSGQGNVETDSHGLMIMNNTYYRAYYTCGTSPCSGSYSYLADAGLYYKESYDAGITWGSQVTISALVTWHMRWPMLAKYRFSWANDYFWMKTASAYSAADYVYYNAYYSPPPVTTTTTTSTTSTTTPSGTTSTTTTIPSGFSLPDIPDAIGDALGINTDAGGLLLSFILFFMVLVPLGMLTKNFWVILIAGLTLAGFLTAITWLPVWIMVMLCLITALMLGSRLTGLASRGGTDEGD